MGLRPGRLGHKLNATLLVLMLGLALAVAALVYFGFQRTQDAARRHSGEGLEDLGRQLVLQIAQAEAARGVFQMENAAQIGHELAAFFADFQAVASSSWDSARLAPGPQGQLYDPSSDRVSDVFIPSFVVMDAAVEADLAASAALDAIFPAVFQHYPGLAQGENYRSVAIYFLSTTNVTRYYPPIGLVEILPSDMRLQSSLAAVGPEQNPRRTTVWSSPYEDDAGQGLLITASTPVYVDEVYRGRIGVDISIQRLVEKVDAVKPTRGSFSFYIDRTGDILPSQSFEALSNALAADRSGALEAMLERMRLGEEAVEQISLNGAPYFIAYAPFGAIGGSFAVAAPVSEITEQAAAVTASIDEVGDRTMLVLLSVIAGFFVVGLAGTTWLSRRTLIQPIEELVAGTKAVADGDLSMTIPARGSDELGDLARAFNDMTGEIRMRRQALEAEIAERQLIQDDLKRWQERHLAMVNSVDAILWEATSDFSSFTFVSAQAERLLGYPVERWLEEPSFWIDHIHPADREWCFRFCTEKAAATEDHDFEYRMLAADGRTVWLRDIVSVVSENGRPVALRGFMVDITALKQAFSALGDREEQYRAVFNSTTDGLVINDAATGRILAANPAFRAMHGWDEMEGFAPEAFVQAEGLAVFAEYLEAIRAGSEFRGGTLMLRRDGSTLEVEVYGRGFSFQGTPAGLAVVRDVSEQTRAFQSLEERVSDRTHELERRKSIAEGLGELLTIVNSGRSLNEILDTVERQSQGLLGSDSSGIILYSEGERQLSIRASQARESWYSISELPPESSAVGLAIRARKPAVIKDVAGAYDAAPQGDGALPEYDDRGDRLVVSYLPEVGGEERISVQRRFAKTYPGFLAVPFASKDKVYGALSLSFREPHDFTDEDIAVATAFTGQSSIAIENAMLYQRAEERTRELAAILEVSRNLSSTLALEPLLNAVIEQLHIVADYRRASIYLLEGEALRLLASRVSGAGIAEAPASYSLSTRDIEPIWRRIAAGEVVLLDDMHADNEINNDLRHTFGTRFQQAAGDLHCQMMLPMGFNDRVIGMLVLTHEEPGYYREPHVQLVSAIATQAAIAIENARLYEQAQQAAALEERQRLARELHDAVTQTLFSTALIAEAIPDLWAVDAGLARERLADLRRLTRGALAEMRTLLVELRPGALSEMPLGDLLRQLGEAAEGRTSLEVTVGVNGSPVALPPEVQIGLYRIAQESLSNTLKHAQAGRAQLALSYLADDWVSLSVSDNGRGFETNVDRPGHLGLEIMRERARAIGAELDVASNPGAGATITAIWRRNGNGSYG